MKNVIIFGASGMVGGEALKECLERKDIGKVTIITRRPLGIKNHKLVEVIHDNFLDYSPIEKYFKEQDLGIYCIGVYTGAVSKEKFEEITVDYTKVAVDALLKNSPDIIFSFLSGTGADRSEKSSVLFARTKGIAENYLFNSKLKNLFVCRPGYIYPSTPRKEPNIGYRIYKRLYKIGIFKISKSLAITSKELAHVMIEYAVKYKGKEVLENKDMKVFLEKEKAGK